ncbi:unnamed protein product [Acanthoscelides obtectus]|uniref:Uncharacterized protein n=1 Tax=Acanthoscelides obtectus TaxID=200917 RepID=A0A9P0JQD6_ACAOB|nr:unnamed protein product [Acanthoscelides obtectus]CAK1661837.1 hypothetical protein AOBTE_LOCUS22829 [Acanthoscelides obtectus]
MQDPYHRPSQNIRAAIVGRYMIDQTIVSTILALPPKYKCRGCQIIFNMECATVCEDSRLRELITLWNRCLSVCRVLLVLVAKGFKCAFHLHRTPAARVCPGWRPPAQNVSIARDADLKERKENFTGRDKVVTTALPKHQQQSIRTTNRIVTSRSHYIFPEITYIRLKQKHLN